MYNQSSSNEAPGVQFNRISLVKKEVQKVIVGQDLLLERLLIALLVEGHVLLEGVPGLAKTKVLTCLSSSMSLKMNRVQFTPDLLPADILGTEIYRPQTGEFTVRKGPIFANLLLADEVNRAPAKVQSALLEAMAEKQVTIGGDKLMIDTPFMVLATQNPIEQTGTYQLPEAQLDRFVMKLTVSYPSFEEELKILQRQLQNNIISPVISPQELMLEKEAASSVYVDPRIEAYIVRLIHATRKPEEFNLGTSISFGASPRGSLALRDCSRALSYLKGKNFVSPDEVKELALDVLRHRIILSFEAESDGLTTDEVISTLLKKVPVP